MLNNNQITIYSDLKKQFHGQLIICGSAAMYYYGLIEKFSDTDFDLILLHNNHGPAEIEEDMKKLELLSMTNSKKSYPVKEEDDKRIGERFFLIFNQEMADKKISNFNVDIFVSKSLLHDGVCLAHYPGMEIFMASPKNVILAKKLFGRTKDILSLSEIAKSIMP